MKRAESTALLLDTEWDTSELEVETVSDYQSFLDLEEVWNHLVQEAGIDHPFLSYEWVRTWWECFGAGKKLHILVIKKNKEPAAIAPLMLSTGRMYGVKVRRLEFIYNDHAQRFDFIVARYPDEVYRALGNYLLRQNDLWDVLQLPQMPAGSTSLSELPRLASRKGFLLGLWRSTDSPYLRLDGTWEAYYEGLPGKHRSNLRNRFKRLGQVGTVKCEVISSGAEMESSLEEGLRIEAMAWKGEAGTAIRCRPEVHLFYTMLAQRCAQRGWLRLHFLSVG